MSVSNLSYAEIKQRLRSLSEDFEQDRLGLEVPDIAGRKAEFIYLHGELRKIEGKDPRKEKEII
jgi:hypothetical protein